MKECRFINKENFKQSCPFCSKSLFDFQEKLSHACSQKHTVIMCPMHRQASRFSLDRIANLDEVHVLLDFVKCQICSNLLKNPKECLGCRLCFCEECIVQSLLLQNYCPQCFEKEPYFSNVSRSIMQMLNNFKIKCMNTMGAAGGPKGEPGRQVTCGG